MARGEFDESEKGGKLVLRIDGTGTLDMGKEYQIHARVKDPVLMFKPTKDTPPLYLTFITDSESVALAEGEDYEKSLPVDIEDETVTFKIIALKKGKAEITIKLCFGNHYLQEGSLNLEVEAPEEK